MVLLLCRLCSIMLSVALELGHVLSQQTLMASSNHYLQGFLLPLSMSSRQEADPVSCQSSSQCFSNGVCQSGMCVCITGTIKIQSGCVYPSELFQLGNSRKQQPSPVMRGSAPGQSCIGSNTLCTGGSYCYNNVCICPINCIIRDNQCVVISDLPIEPFSPPMALPGQVCLNSTTCIGGLLCVAGVCQCPLGCVIRDNQCADCVGDVVQMQPPMPTLPLPTLGAITEPVTPATPGQSCATGQVCVGGSFCLSGLCLCPSNCVIISSVCVPLNRLMVTNASTASVPSLVRAAGTTAAAIFMRPVAPGLACGNGDMCVGGSSCMSGTCQCPPLYFVQNGICVLSVASTSAPASVTISPYVSPQPVFSVPTPPPFVTDVSQMPPLLSSSASAADAWLQPNPNALIWNSVSYNEDRGGSGSHAQVSHVYFGGPCKSTQQCGGSAFCVRGQCACAQGDIRIGDYCVSEGKVAAIERGSMAFKARAKDPNGPS